MKKIVWLLCLILFFSSFISCSSNRPLSNESGFEVTSSEMITSEIENAEHIFSLPYFSSDSLNPYSAQQSVNFYLGTLLYDPLFELDENFNAVAVIADKITQQGTVCTVTIKKDIKFSDGSNIELKDIVASFSAAKKSNYFSQRLSNAVSCKISGNSVVFTLKNADVNFVKNLNFPIIKSGSTESKAIGSGRFCFATEQTVLGLCKNQYSIRKNSKIQNVSLVEIHKYSTLPYMIKIGSVNFVYANYSDFDIKTAASKISSVLMNNLVYLGINSDNPYLANQDFRKAVSLIINRKSILTDAYANSGFATAAPFHPQAADLNTEDYSFDLTNIEAAAQLLLTAGFAQKNENGIFTSFDGTPISLRLAVNKNNSARLRAAQAIKLSLEAAGIAVELIQEDANAYKKRIASNDYDLFIGEVKLTPDNNVSSLLSSGPLNACDDGGETVGAYRKYISGEITLAEFLRVFDLKTPFIPILYRNGTAVFSGTLSGNGMVTEYDVFAVMENWVY